jgi:DnaJ-class molecular chaperone
MDTTTTGTSHDQTQEDPTDNSESMLTEFMRGKTLPASYKEWKVCHHCGKREPAGQPFRQCGHCKTMGVEHIILYCVSLASSQCTALTDIAQSRDCQRGDWPDHKKICGNQEGSYDMKKDTGYVFLKPCSNKWGRLLLEWNHVYRRMLVS